MSTLSRAWPIDWAGTTMIRKALATIAATMQFGCAVELLHDLNEAEANEILAILHGKGVKAEKKRSLSGSKSYYALIVSSSDAQNSWKILRDNGYPRRRKEGLGEIFGNKKSLVPSKDEQRALLRHALAGELTKTLERIAGVVEARVHIVIPDRHPFARNKGGVSRPRASVLLKTGSLSPISEHDVKRLVAGGVERMSPDDVEVVFSVGPPAKIGFDGSRDRESIVSLGPFRVARQSRNNLLLIIVSLVVGLLASCLGALLCWLRYRTAKRYAVSASTGSRKQFGPRSSHSSVLDPSNWKQPEQRSRLPEN